MKKVVYESIKEVNALIAETYVTAIILAIIAIAIAYLIARSINWKGGKDDNSHFIRRIWFIIIGLIVPISFFLYNMLVVSEKISKAPLIAKFSSANVYSTLILLGVYILLGISTMLIFRKSKWGSSLGRSK
jgi:hypothetical protein